jgi:TPP-dependent pyruvate/acetoin dehydrogenase alpha subunit
MSQPSGFEYSVRKNGDVVITHHRRQAAVLRGAKADRFLDQVEMRDPQELMARLTGNDKRGNERRSREHT